MKRMIPAGIAGTLAVLVVTMVRATNPSPYRDHTGRAAPVSATKEQPMQTELATFGGG